MARKAEELYKEALTLSAEEREELKRLLSMQADSGWASFADCVLVRALALVPSAVTSPFSIEIRSRSAVTSWGSTNKRRLYAISPRTLAIVCERPFLGAIAVMPAPCSSRE